MISEDDRQAPAAVLDTMILAIAAELASNYGWKKVAQRLEHAGKVGRLAFPLDGQSLARETKDCTDDEERMEKVLVAWRAMHPDHTRGPLYDALYMCGYGRVAEQVLVTPLSYDSGKFGFFFQHKRPFLFFLMRS